MLDMKNFTVWFTGFPGSGKTTLSNLLKEELLNNNNSSVTLDGDIIRQGLSSDLGFCDSDRNENIRRCAEIAKILNNEFINVVAGFISPSHYSREIARNIIGEDRFIEIWLSTPVSICEKRDTKGMYRKARMGFIEKFTGVSSQYEEPSNANIILDTTNPNTNLCIIVIMKYLRNRNYIK